MISAEGVIMASPRGMGTEAAIASHRQKEKFQKFPPLTSSPTEDGEIPEWMSTETPDLSTAKGAMLRAEDQRW